MKLQKITPNLWFDNQAEEAARFYASVFKNAEIGEITRYGKEGYEVHGMPEGTIMTVDFQIEGQKFIALNGGPHFQFNEAISFIVDCETQDEVDYYWDKLGEGGDPKAQNCGWLKDKFGVSWQVFPATLLNEILRDEDEEKSQKVMAAILKMKKIEIKGLREAFDQ